MSRVLQLKIAAELIAVLAGLTGATLSIELDERGMFPGPVHAPGAVVEQAPGGPDAVCEQREARVELCVSPEPEDAMAPPASAEPGAGIGLGETCP